MATHFKVAPHHASPGLDGKATWTNEDRDYIWLNRVPRLLTALTIILPAPFAAWCLMRGIAINESVHLPYLVAFVLVIGVPIIAGPTLSTRLRHYLDKRFHHSRQRHLYSRREWPPSIEEAIDAHETIMLPRDQRLEQRNAILAPLRHRVAWFKRLFRRTAIVQWTIAALTLAYAVSGEAANASQIATAIMVAISMILSGLTLAPVWQSMIYDLPARWNPMVVDVPLSAPMSKVLQDACEDDGIIWLVDHEIVPRALFKTPFGALLLGEPWDAAHLPFGLWAATKHIRKEMSGEIRGYCCFAKLLHDQADQQVDENE